MLERFHTKLESHTGLVSQPTHSNWPLGELFMAFPHKNICISGKIRLVMRFIFPYNSLDQHKLATPIEIYGILHQIPNIFLQGSFRMFGLRYIPQISVKLLSRVSKIIKNKILNCKQHGFHMPITPSGTELDFQKQL